MDHIWNFHDSVISKIDYVSGSFGSQEGTYPLDDKRELKYQLLLLEIFTFRKVFLPFLTIIFFFVGSMFSSILSTFLSLIIIPFCSIRRLISDFELNIESFERKSTTFVLLERLISSVGMFLSAFPFEKSSSLVFLAFFNFKFTMNKFGHFKSHEFFSLHNILLAHSLNFFDINLCEKTK